MVDLEKLTSEERISYQSLIEQYNSKQLSISDIKEYVTTMLLSVIGELVETENNLDEKNTYLKARAKNYLLFRNMLVVPEIAKKQLDEALKSFEKRIDK